VLVGQWVTAQQFGGFWRLWSSNRKQKLREQTMNPGSKIVSKCHAVDNGYLANSHVQYIVTDKKVGNLNTIFFELGMLEWNKLAAQTGFTVHCITKGYLF
jgi:hypothetical protein